MIDALAWYHFHIEDRNYFKKKQQQQQHWKKIIPTFNSRAHKFQNDGTTYLNPYRIYFNVNFPILCICCMCFDCLWMSVLLYSVCNMHDMRSAWKVTTYIHTYMCVYIYWQWKWNNVFEFSLHINFISQKVRLLNILCSTKSFYLFTCFLDFFPHFLNWVVNSLMSSIFLSNIFFFFLGTGFKSKQLHIETI